MFLLHMVLNICLRLPEHVFPLYGLTAHHFPCMWNHRVHNRFHVRLVSALLSHPFPLKINHIDDTLLRGLSEHDCFLSSSVDSNESWRTLHLCLFWDLPLCFSAIWSSSSSCLSKYLLQMVHSGPRDFLHVLNSNSQLMQGRVWWSFICLSNSVWYSWIPCKFHKQTSVFPSNAY